MINREKMRRDGPKIFDNALAEAGLLVVVMDRAGLLNSDVNDPARSQDQCQMGSAKNDIAQRVQGGIWRLKGPRAAGLRNSSEPV